MMPAVVNQILQNNMAISGRVNGISLIATIIIYSLIVVLIVLLVWYVLSKFHIQLRKCKHDWMLIDSFSWEGSFGYNRIAVFRCMKSKCGDINWFHRWAFMKHSGALRSFFHTDIAEDTEYPLMTEDEAANGIKNILSKYFVIENDRVVCPKG